MKVFIDFALIPLEIKCYSILQKRLIRVLDISNCDVIYYVIYVICSHYLGKAISPLFAWPSSNNNTSSQMLLDHCYTFGLLLIVAVAFQLWRSIPLEKGPHWPIMALPWIHNCADLAQQSIQMCGSHEYSQMLVDNCYAFILLLQHSTLKEKFFGEGAPHLRIIALLWICP